MNFVFEERPSDSPFIETIWRTQSEGGGSFTSLAQSHWGLVVTRQIGKTYITVRGPETKATPAPIPVDAEFIGFVFKLGTFMPHLPARNFVNDAANLPEAASNAFWLQGASWQFPTYENADTFVAKLIREGLLTHDGVVDAVLQEQPQPLSIRTVRRRFLLATGLTHKAIQQIERAHRAAALLRQGVSILDTVYQAGYFDQPHLTRSLKYFIGQTPAQIVRIDKSE